MIFKSDNPSPLTRLADSMIPARLKQGQPEPSPDIKMGQIVITDFANSRVLDRLLMYERRMENSLYKTMLELQRLRLARNLDNIAPANNQQRTGFEQNMQNEPNFKNMEMYSNQMHKTDYEQLLKFSHPKNEPKRTQFKPNFPKCRNSAQTNIAQKLTKKFTPQFPKNTSFP